MIIPRLCLGLVNVCRIGVYIRPMNYGGQSYDAHEKAYKEKLSEFMTKPMLETAAGHSAFRWSFSIKKLKT